MQAPLERKKLHDYVFDKLPMKSLGLISDVFDYLSEGDNPSWSLGKDHMQTLHMIIGHGKIDELARATVFILLQKFVLRQDFLPLLEREPSQIVFQSMKHFDNLPEKIQASFIKMVSV